MLAGGVGMQDGSTSMPYRQGQPLTDWAGDAGMPGLAAHVSISAGDGADCGPAEPQQVSCNMPLPEPAVLLADGLGSASVAGSPKRHVGSGSGAGGLQFQGMVNLAEGPTVQGGFMDDEVQDQEFLRFLDALPATSSTSSVAKAAGANKSAVTAVQQPMAPGVHRIGQKPLGDSGGGCSAKRLDSPQLSIGDGSGRNHQHQRRFPFLQQQQKEGLPYPAVQRLASLQEQEMSAANMEVQQWLRHAPYPQAHGKVSMQGCHAHEGMQAIHSSAAGAAAVFAPDAVWPVLKTCQFSGSSDGAAPGTPMQIQAAVSASQTQQEHGGQPVELESCPGRMSRPQFGVGLERWPQQQGTHMSSLEQALLRGQFGGPAPPQGQPVMSKQHWEWLAALPLPQRRAVLLQLQRRRHAMQMERLQQLQRSQQAQRGLPMQCDRVSGGAVYPPCPNGTVGQQANYSNAAYVLQQHDIVARSLSGTGASRGASSSCYDQHSGAIQAVQFSEHAHPSSDSGCVGVLPAGRHLISGGSGVAGLPQVTTSLVVGSSQSQAAGLDHSQQQQLPVGASASRACSKAALDRCPSPACSVEGKRGLGEDVNGGKCDSLELCQGLPGLVNGVDARQPKRARRDSTIMPNPPTPDSNARGPLLRHSSGCSGAGSMGSAASRGSERIGGLQAVAGLHAAPPPAESVCVSDATMHASHIQTKSTGLGSGASCSVDPTSRHERFDMPHAAKGVAGRYAQLAAGGSGYGSAQELLGLCGAVEVQADGLHKDCQVAGRAEVSGPVYTQPQEGKACSKSVAAGVLFSASGTPQVLLCEQDVPVDPSASHTGKVGVAKALLPTAIPGDPTRQHSDQSPTHTPNNIGRDAPCSPSGSLRSPPSTPAAGASGPSSPDVALCRIPYSLGQREVTLLRAHLLQAVQATLHGQRDSREEDLLRFVLCYLRFNQVPKETLCSARLVPLVGRLQQHPNKLLAQAAQALLSITPWSNLWLQASGQQPGTHPCMATISCRR